MNLKEAKQITGGLSSPSKMPGYAYNLPAPMCITGRTLVDVIGSVCEGCYALKGRYRFPNVKDALNRRLNSLTHPQWIEAMTFLISHYSKKIPFFRWHDSGDLQSAYHLKQIFEVCNNTPDTAHWLPTRESRFLPLYHDSIPKNLIIRMSSHKIDQAPVKSWPWTSTVTTKHGTCPAPYQGGKCVKCRTCWDRLTPNVIYAKH